MFPLPFRGRTGGCLPVWMSAADTGCGDLPSMKNGRLSGYSCKQQGGKLYGIFPSYKMLQDVYDTAMESGLLSETEVICQKSHLTETEREEFLARFREADHPVLGFVFWAEYSRRGLI